MKVDLEVQLMTQQKLNSVLASQQTIQKPSNKRFATVATSSAKATGYATNWKLKRNALRSRFMTLTTRILPGAPLRKTV